MSAPLCYLYLYTRQVLYSTFSPPKEAFVTLPQGSETDKLERVTSNTSQASQESKVARALSISGEPNPFRRESAVAESARPRRESEIR
ncbi:MAG: hypothetical protein M1814_005135 [Vezdaea aestivalis]|nr:MAG: hypothetical protein M1814_005135 [Vezdaea aestivalis]